MLTLRATGVDRRDQLLTARVIGEGFGEEKEWVGLRFRKGGT